MYLNQNGPQIGLSAPESPARDGSMHDIFSRLCSIHEQARASLGVLDDTGDRAFGPAPAGIGSASAAQTAPQQSGLAYQISVVLTQIAETQDRIRDAIQRVGSAI